MSLLTANDEVYTGAWVNWAEGRVQGATLTVPARQGAYLVAFLAIFVQITGAHFWNIFCVGVFYFRSTHKPKDGLHHQYQAILRNSTSASATLWQFLGASWFWRQRRKGAFGFAFPWVVFACINIAAFTAAGILSSRVTNARSQVLLKEHNCGDWSIPSSNQPNDEIKYALSDYEQHMGDRFRIASVLARSCYDNSTKSNNCNPYGVDRLNFTTTTGIKCPFEDKMCKNNLAVRLDTGPLDSQTDLGINAPVSDRMTERILLECAPLLRDGYLSDWHMPYPDIQLPGKKYRPDKESFIDLNYGPNVESGYNFTVTFSNLTQVLDSGSFGSLPFLLDQVYSNIDSYQSFEPIPELNRTDADVFILTIGMDYLFTEAVNDPWFEATKEEVVTFIGSMEDVSLFSPKIPISSVGCTLQYEICTYPTSSQPKRCTDLNGRSPVMYNETFMDSLSPAQNATYRRLMSTGGNAAVPYIALSMRSPVMMASEMRNPPSPPLPDDQWIRELQHLFATTLVTQQINLYELPTAGYPPHQEYVKRMPDNYKWMCSNQMVRRESYTSFSILGLSLIVGVGCILILVSFSLSFCIKQALKRRGKPENLGFEWDVLEVTALQRLAYEQYDIDLARGEGSNLPILHAVDFLRPGKRTWTGPLNYHNTRQQTAFTDTSNEDTTMVKVSMPKQEVA